MSETRTRTILLADLVGSTIQVSSLPTNEGAKYLQEATQPMKDAILRFRVRSSNLRAMDILGTFASANDALEAADKIRSYYLQKKHSSTGIPMEGVRVVVHTADIVEGDDIIGDGVIVTARLEKNVPANAIWVTAATREICSDVTFEFEDIGEIPVRGRNRPAHVFALVGSHTSYVEDNITLLITDLHHYIQTGETLSPTEIHTWLMRWSDFHREALVGLKGRIRQFVADMALLTFSDPDEAIQATLNMIERVNTYNQSREKNTPEYRFKAALSSGDLILSPTGVVGPLVNLTFKVLNSTPRERIGISTVAYDLLNQFKNRTEAHESIYLLKQGK